MRDHKMLKLARFPNVFKFSIVAFGTVLVSTPSWGTCNPLKPIEAYDSCGRTLEETKEAVRDTGDAALKATMDLVTRKAAKEKARRDAIDAAAAEKARIDGDTEDLRRFLIKEEVKTELKSRSFDEKWGHPAAPSPSPSPVPLPPGASLGDPDGVKLDVAAKGRIGDL